MNDITSTFASMVFNERVMQTRLPKETYRALKKAIDTKAPLDLEIANVVANAMKDWAIENGANHYTHWFQPMTGITAEKHTSFVAPGDGRVIMEFSAKELVQGEPDASSFPSGGLRATFEARGYTIWDITSYAFIKDSSLYIPTAFCSYHGEALDKKTPLLRSMEALDKQAMRILRLFGNDTAAHVQANVGAEQEYFLIDKAVYLKRPDLVFTGRTLFGARAPKGQDLEDHYFGSIKPRVQAFMKDLDERLWALGIYSKNKHNEVAPAQHELTVIYNTTNIATDQNQLIMELMKSIADKHNLVCLLHEKPFAGLNGSGKHNNWSLATDDGVNLLEPGHTPHENAQFLLFLAAVIQAVDNHQDLLRASVATAANDHRLGASEAPPAIISMFLGDELTEILTAIAAGSSYEKQEQAAVQIGVTTLPHFPKDTTDRNRTSPMAFTGNKFEFRMPGSALSIAGPNVVLNTIVADALCSFAERLENAEDFNSALSALIKEVLHAHSRIIFNGNNYTSEWAREAERRGLSNLATTVDALPAFIAPKSLALFCKHCVLTESELHSRYHILLENYCKVLHIEALTMIDLIKKEILPSCIAYQNELCALLSQKKSLGYDTFLEKSLLQKISGLSCNVLKKVDALENALIESKQSLSEAEVGRFYRDTIFRSMSEIRANVDELETQVAKKYWTLPTYADILYSV